MKVVAKFAIAFFAASVVCLSVFGYVLANREAARLERAFAAGLTSYGMGLSSALETAWREHGYEAAERIVASGFDPNGEVRVRLERDGTNGTNGTNGTDDASSRKRAVPASTVVITVQEDPQRGKGHHLVQARTGITGPDGGVAVLTLERPLTTGREILRTEVGDQILAVGALAVIMALLAVTLGGIVIGGPLRRIVAQARRIGEGDLSQRLRATGNDEIGILKRELNAMCDRLASASARIEEETAARIETLERLRHLDRLRTVGTIASGVAHELGTPLNVLLLRGQSLAKDDTLTPEDVRDAGASVLSQVEKMSRIVRQLLDFARARRREKAAVDSEDQLLSSDVDLGEVARHAASLLASLAKKNGVTVLVEEDKAKGARVTTQGDFGQLEQALTNLIVNGIQAMPDGGNLIVRVSSTTAVSVGEASGALIEVIDEGQGMSDAVREQVFEPFFTTKATTEGTGLGLHVARGIAQDHGGTITAASRPGGRGSTFALRLPAKRRRESSQ